MGLGMIAPGVAGAGVGHLCLQRLSYRGARRNLFLCSRLPTIRAEKSIASESEPQKRRRRLKKRTKVAASDAELTELGKIIELLPTNVRKKLQSYPELHTLLEVVMDLGRVPFARFPDGDYTLSKCPVTNDDLKFATAQLGEFGGDNRAGISGTLHRISCLRNRKGTVIGLTARVGRHVGDSSKIVADIIQEGKSILVLGYPGTGKTTAIRSMCKLLADAEKKRVVVVDTSNEIAGDGDVPHVGIGKARRMQVAHPSRQHEVMIEAVENHTPQVIVIDEIGTDLECTAARTIAQRGVQLIATVHATELENLVKNPNLQDLVGGIESVTLGDEEARRRRKQKSVLERAAPPAFDVAIEMKDRATWEVHHDLAAAVDTILAGGTPSGEIRSHTKANNQPIQTPPSPSRPFLPPPGRPISLKDFKPELEWTAAEEIPVDPRPPSSLIRPTRRKELSESDILDHQKDHGFYNEWEGDSDWNFFNDREGGARNSIDAIPSSVALRLFLIGVGHPQLNEILEVLGVEGQIAVTAYLKKAHAVLGMEAEMKKGGWVEKAARVDGIPMFSLNSGSNLALAKAIQSLLGLSSSTQLPLRSGATEEKPEKKTIPISMAEADALEEVHRAVDSVIIPTNQPAELAPQKPQIIDLQMNLIDRYNYPFEVVGEGKYRRLRIYPSSEMSDGPIA